MEKVTKCWVATSAFYSEHKYIIDLILAVFKASLALIILAFFAANFALSIETQDDINALNDNQDLAFSSIAITHELAKERGMSNLFVSSAGTAFGSRVSVQRDVVDNVLSTNRPVLERFSDSGSDKSRNLVQAILADLNRLSSIRSRVDIRNITSPEVISFYTTLNNNLVSVTGLLNPPDAGKVTKAINAYIQYAYFKDKLGLERATITALTYRSYYLAGERDRILNHIQSQDAFVILFNISAKPEHANLLENLKQEAKWTNFTSKASEVMGQSSNLTLSFTYDNWWDSITIALDNMKDTLEEALRKDLQSETDDALANTRTLIIINSFGMALTIIIVLGFIVVIFLNAGFALAKYMRTKQKVIDMTREIKGDGNWD